MTKHITISLIIVLLFITLTGCGSNEKYENADNTLPSDTPVEEKNVVDKVYDAASPVETAENNSESQLELELSSEQHSWCLQTNKEHKTPSINQEIKNLLSEHNAYYVLPGKENKIYLTFDQGYELGYTGQILDTLKANNIKAAFFISGHYLKSQPELVKRMKAEGHMVCNHTWNHPDLSTVSKETLNQEVLTLQQEFYNITGYEMDKYLRPPMGNYSEESLEWTRQMGYTTIFWSLAFADWDPDQQPGADFSYQYVMNNIHPGAIVLLHAVSKSNAEALDKIIKDLEEKGYMFSNFAF